MSTGLSCGTTYHYRASANNDGGHTNGLDKSFTTSPCPANPDLTLDVSVSKNNAFVGENIPFTATIQNLGNKDATTGSVSLNCTIYPSSSQLAYEDIIRFAYDVYTRALPTISASGGSFTINDTFQMPQSDINNFVLCGLYPQLYGGSEIDSDPGNDCDNCIFDIITEAVTYKNLNASIQGEGEVNSDPLGIACGNDCDESFLTGSTITLSAMSISGWIFKRWTGQCSGNQTSCDIFMDTNKNVSAVFEKETVDGTKKTIIVPILELLLLGDEP